MLIFKIVCAESHNYFRIFFINSRSFKITPTLIKFIISVKTKLSLLIEHYCECITSPSNNIKTKLTTHFFFAEFNQT